jgi:hypothetical protein
MRAGGKMVNMTGIKEKKLAIYINIHMIYI